MKPYIKGIVDVIGDGHCGFRAIAESVGLTDESYIWCGEQLLKSLKSIGKNTSRYMRASAVITTSWMDCILPKMLVVLHLSING